MDVTKITFNKTICFINRLFMTVGYPPCEEENPPTLLRYLIKNLWFFVAYVWIFSVALAQFLFVATRPFEANIWEYLVQEVTVGYCTVGLTKMFMLAKRRKSLSTLLRNFHRIWPNQVKTAVDKEIVESYMHYNTMFAVWFSGLSVIMGYFWNMIPLGEMMFYKLVYGENIRALPFNIWVPFDEFDTAYPYVYMYLLYSAHTVVVYHIAFDSLFCISISHLCMHYRLLQENLKVVVDDPKEDERPSNAHENMNRLKSCIEKHQCLTRIRKYIEEIFTDVIFMNFFVSSINICSVGFLMATNRGYHAMKFFMLFLCYLVELFLFCWFGQELIDNSSSVAYSAYESSWYSTTQKFKKIMILVIHRSQFSEILTALKFWDISLNTFRKILSASWSYFALLHTALAELPYMKREGGI
ncbi:Odorant receptor [Sergentomyia squamirostris]